MLWTPRSGNGALACSQSSTSAEGITVTASSSTHTKGSWGTTPLWTSTPFHAYGITVAIHNTGVASASHKVLVDIGIGSAGAEVVIIPNLIGLAGGWANASNGGTMYHFPIFIPAGTRVNARCQANTASKNAFVIAWLTCCPTGPNGWTGSRVTAYGANTATSGGVAHTPGSTNAYATATQIVSSTTNPVKYLQVGIDLAADTTATNMRGMFRLGLGATPDYFASGLGFGESTTIETMEHRIHNALLSRMLFNFPAGSDLRLSAMVSGTGESRQWALYGVD